MNETGDTTGEVTRMLKVCFVDDDKDVSELMKYAGEKQRVWIVTFTNGPEALTFLDNNQVDAVMLDLAMPVMDGLSLAEEIRRNEENHPERRKAKIGFLTGWPVNETIMRVARRVNAEQIFRKPIDPDETIATIKGWFFPAVQTNAAA